VFKAGKINLRGYLDMPDGRLLLNKAAVFIDARLVILFIFKADIE